MFARLSSVLDAGEVVALRAKALENLATELQPAASEADESLP